MNRPVHRKPRDSGVPDLRSRVRSLLTFVQMDAFPPAWKRLGLDDEDLRSLELEILSEPTRPPVVAGTGGLRKLRFAPPKWRRGKSGATRVYYAHFPDHALVTLLFVHDKESMSEIPDHQRRTIRLLLEDIRRHLDATRRRKA